LVSSSKLNSTSNPSIIDRQYGASDKNFARAHGKSSGPLAEKIFSKKIVLDLLTVFDNITYSVILQALHLKQEKRILLENLRQWNKRVALSVSGLPNAGPPKARVRGSPVPPLRGSDRQY